MGLILLSNLNISYLVVIQGMSLSALLVLLVPCKLTFLRYSNQLQRFFQLSQTLYHPYAILYLLSILFAPCQSHFSAILLNCATCQSCKKTCKAIYFLHFFLLSLPALSILICKISFIFVHNYYFLSFSCLPLSNALL